MTLKPKALDTLVYLVRKPGRVVEKDELLHAVWPDAFVEENNLNQCVSQVRRALGEARGENRYVVTVSGRGYRFAAEVSALKEDGRHPASPEPDRTPDEPPEQPAAPARVERGGASRRVVALALLAVAGLGAAGWFVWGRSAAVIPAACVRTVAVLPFKPLVMENRDEALEMGMADTLIARLGGVGGMTVRPLSAVRRYAGAEQDPVAAGRELGVDAVLDGSIQRWGDRVRVTTRLVGVADGAQLWSGQFDEKFTDIFDVQDSISRRLTRALSVELSGAEAQRLARHDTDDAAAYELYLKGRFLLGQTQRDSILKAIAFFEEAIEKDRDYAVAYVGLAECYTRLPITSDVRPADAFPRAKEAALRALELDPGLAEARTILGWVKLWNEWDWKGAEDDFRSALSAEPDHVYARVGYAHLLSSLGRDDEALAEVDRALAVDPAAVQTGAMKGHYLHFARRYPEAIAQLERTLELNPNYWVTLVVLGRTYVSAGRYDDAVGALTRAREASGGTTETISLIGYVYARTERREEAERILSELEALSRERYVPPYNVAVVYLGLGRFDETMAWLDRAYADRDVHMIESFWHGSLDELEPSFGRLARGRPLGGA